ncbi:excinuclease ABC subunit UvrC [Methylophilaceae bacterium]|nr:excinuclease ABC subunit UvrC [Nitrosomonadales bacterium]MCH9771064.1 excinuclease ABC subunit UvrC [Betaproteobacteria bacterium]MDA9086638.1 excinuclease ABC subunit UvrC [Methylophilaceae bacterium]MDC1109560.1 excinuclease ABC subunit UvrC [Methylophilaceae bacterium]
MTDLKKEIKKFPNLPGIYRMMNGKNEIIYIGKAKDIKKRVASYFGKNHSSPRTKMMVSNIHSIEFTVTNTEAEALILENNLIRNHMPRYNVIFRDDKSYPYLKISGDQFPRISFHRGIQKKDQNYFGPFPNSPAVRDSIKLLQKVFLLRTCENSVFRNRSRPCMEHQIQRCSAPCVNLISEQDYKEDIDQAMLFLNGKDTKVINSLSEKMSYFAEKNEFERAAVFRDRIQSLRQVRLKQFVSDFSENDADIIAIEEKAGIYCVNLVMIRNSKHLGDKSFFPKGAVDSQDNNILEIFIAQYYNEKSPPPVVIIEKKVNKSLLEKFFELKKYRKIKIITRLTKEKRMWMEMAKKNALINISQQSNEKLSFKNKVEAFTKLLNIDSTKNRIECFDVSHMMGEGTVASCVVFDKNGIQKKDYRKYNIKNNKPGDDYGAMREVLERRYTKMINTEAIKPDVVLIDGGKGQLGVAKKVMSELGLTDIFLVGVTKGEKRKSGDETLHMANGDILENIDTNNVGFQLIIQIRDEAHRFAITGHRARRKKSRFTSSLEEIEGIGQTKRRNLLVYFGGIQGIKEANIPELLLVEGINVKLAENIYNYFH